MNRHNDSIQEIFETSGSSEIIIGASPELKPVDRLAGLDRVDQAALEDLEPAGSTDDGLNLVSLRAIAKVVHGLHEDLMSSQD